MIIIVQTIFQLFHVIIRYIYRPLSLSTHPKFRTPFPVYTDTLTTIMTVSRPRSHLSRNIHISLSARMYTARTLLIRRHTTIRRPHLPRPLLPHRGRRYEIWMHSVVARRHWHRTRRWRVGRIICFGPISCPVRGPVRGPVCCPVCCSVGIGGCLIPYFGFCCLMLTGGGKERRAWSWWWRVVWVNGWKAWIWVWRWVRV